MSKKLTREQAAIIGAYTGFNLGPFEDIQELIEKLELGPLASGKERQAALRTRLLAIVPDRTDP